tara:strand:- start:426 stop:1271 length:846 start_codon:yes stop_codon:yes gene_type:complete
MSSPFADKFLGKSPMSPASKALVGGQNRLSPEHQAAIEASPAEMHHENNPINQSFGIVEKRPVLREPDHHIYKELPKPMYDEKVELREVKGSEKSPRQVNQLKPEIKEILKDGFVRQNEKPSKKDSKTHMMPSITPNQMHEPIDKELKKLNKKYGDTDFYERADVQALIKKKTKAKEAHKSDGKVLPIDDKNSYEYDYDQNEDITTAPKSKKKTSGVNYGSPLDASYSNPNDYHYVSNAADFQRLQDNIVSGYDSYKKAGKNKCVSGSITVNKDGSTTTCP